MRGSKSRKGVVRKDEGNEWMDQRCDTMTGASKGQEGWMENGQEEKRERVMEGSREYNQGTKKWGSRK